MISTLIVKSCSVPLVFAAVGATIISLGCRYSPPHPPTFADFRRVGPGMLEDEKKWKAQLVVLEAAMLSPRDIEVIRANKNPQELVGAALNAKVGDKNISALTREAFLHGSNDPVILTGIAQSLIREIANGVQGARDGPDLQQVLTALGQLEPDNGLTLCLRAYLQLKQGETNAAQLSVKAATQKPALRLHGAELRRCVLQAAITAKYPRFTASMLAIGTLGTSAEVSVVGRQLLNNPQLDRATAEACLELGRRHEAQAKLFIDQLIAFSLQKRALELLKPTGFEQELKRMQDAKEQIKKATAFLDSATAHTASERQWLAYFETLFEQSEFEAVKQLAVMLNQKL